MKAVVCALIIVAAGTTVSAQKKPPRPHRSGLWGEVASGPGSVRVACSGCTNVVTARGPTSILRIGGTVSDHVLIGVEIFTHLDRAFGFVPKDTSATAETGTIAAVVLWYPGRHGLFFKGGVGPAFGQFSLPSSPTTADTSRGGGVGLTFGVGWDWSISRKFAITANVSSYVTAVGDIVLPGRRVDDVIASMYSGAIGFTFR